MCGAGCIFAAAVVVAAVLLGGFSAAVCLDVKQQGATQVIKQAGIGVDSEVSFMSLEGTGLHLRGKDAKETGMWTFSTKTYVHPEEDSDVPEAKLVRNGATFTFQGNMRRHGLHGMCTRREVGVRAESAVGKLTVEGQAQAYTVDGVTVANSADISVGSGSLSVEDVQAAVLAVGVDSGSGSVRNAEVGAISAHVNSGSLSVHDVDLKKPDWIMARDPECSVHISVKSGNGFVEIDKDDNYGPCTLALSVRTRLLARVPADRALTANLSGFRAGDQWLTVCSSPGLLRHVHARRGLGVSERGRKRPGKLLWRWWCRHDDHLRGQWLDEPRL